MPAASPDAVCCLVCGGAYRQLSAHHLRGHGLTSASYRSRFDLPADEPLICLTLRERYRELAAARRDAVLARQRARLARRARRVCA